MLMLQVFHTFGVILFFFFKLLYFLFFFFFQAEDGIRDLTVTGVQTCALPISALNILDPVTLRLDSSNVDGCPVGYDDEVSDVDLIHEPIDVSGRCTNMAEIGRASCRERV